MQKFKGYVLMMLLNLVVLTTTRCQISNGQVDIRKFGAIGDGHSDDGPVIQKALNLAGRKRLTTIYFPAGTYRIINPGNGKGKKDFYGLKIHSNTILKLDKNAILTKQGEEALLSNFVSEPVQNIAILGGQFTSSSGLSGKWQPTKDGIFLTDAQHIIIKNASFHRIGNRGVILNGDCYNIQIIGNDFYDIFNTAISLNMQSVQHVVIRNNNIHAIGGDGIIINGNNSLITENSITNIGFLAGKPYGSGIALGTDKRSCSYDTISNNVIAKSGAFGIISNDCKESVIIENIINDCRMSGIKVGGGSVNSIISTNRIVGAGSASWDNGMYGKSGIILQGSHSIVENNTLDSITGNGIYIDKYAFGSKINGNIIKSLITRDRLSNNAIVNDADYIELNGNTLNNSKGFGILMGNRYIPKGVSLSNNRSDSKAPVNRFKAGTKFKSNDSRLKFQQIK